MTDRRPTWFTLADWQRARSLFLQDNPGGDWRAAPHSVHVFYAMKARES